MEQPLNKFSVFILENSSSENAVEFCKQLGVEKESIFIYENLKIKDVRQIKETSSIVSDRKQGFIFGTIGFDAQNALLKLLEEPYELTYFIMYKSDGLLDTIKSRAQIIKQNINLETDVELLEAIEQNNKEELILKASALQNLPKENIVAVLEGISKKLSFEGWFKKSDIINKEVAKLKEFNLNQKLFLYALFFKLSGRV